MVEEQDTGDTEISLVRQQHGIRTVAEISGLVKPNLVKAIAVGKALCPSGSSVYAAKLLKVSRSTLRRLRIKHGIPAARE